MLQAVTGGALAAGAIPWLGISAPELACFGFFWAIQVGGVGGGAGWHAFEGSGLGQQRV